MRKASWTFFVLAIVLMVSLGACSFGDGGSGEHDRGTGETGEGGEHSEGGEGGEGEESGDELALTEGYDHVRNGARLILAYDSSTNSFTGTVENTTDAILRQVRVEVHLSNGVELGPTVAADLAPGDKRAVALEGTVRPFDGWSAHAEVATGSDGGEHGEGGEGSHSG